jgi:hypothetical protein
MLICAKPSRPSLPMTPPSPTFSAQLAGGGTIEMASGATSSSSGSTASFSQKRFRPRPPRQRTAQSTSTNGNSHAARPNHCSSRSAMRAPGRPIRFLAVALIDWFHEGSLGSWLTSAAIRNAPSARQIRPQVRTVKRPQLRGSRAEYLRPESVMLAILSPQVKTRRSRFIPSSIAFSSCTIATRM